MQPVSLSCLFLFRFPRKHLGRIVHALCFSRVNDSLIRCIFSQLEVDQGK